LLGQAFQRQVGIDRVEHVGSLVEQHGQPAGGDHLGRAADFGLHAGDQAFHHRHIAPEHADQHLVLGVAADHAVGLGHLDGDARQLGGVADKRIERQVDAGRDDAALVGAIEIDGIEGRRRAEIDDDEITGLGMGGNGIDRAIRTQRARLVHVDVDRIADRPLARDQRLDPEVVGGKHLQVVQRAGHDGGNDDLRHRLAIDAADGEQLHEPYRVFIAGPAWIGGDAPARLQLAIPRPRRRCRLEQGENDVGVAGIDGEQHGHDSCGFRA
jgi:hypothetical protein